MLDAGLLHGIPSPSAGQEPTTVALHPLSAAGPPDSEDALAQATVTSVGVTASTLDVNAGEAGAAILRLRTER